MEFISATIDCIHVLMEQSAALRDQGFDVEAELLVKEAEDYAEELRALQASKA